MKEERAEMQDTRTQFNPRQFKKYCQHCLQDILGDAIPMQEKVCRLTRKTSFARRINFHRTATNWLVEPTWTVSVKMLLTHNFSKQF